MKTTRPIPIADHLWEALERMAEQMGSDREALVNEALHALARMHGYVLPAGAVTPTGQRPPPPPPIHPDDRARREVAERVLEQAAALERDLHEATPPGDSVPPLSGPTGPALFLVGDGGELGRVGKDRFVIGRGKHCDLVIDSSKVSREHAAIVREGDAWFIEDLGSSNGTWHQRARIQRRQIQDGDEYFICSERVRCVLR
ncbi:MAG TPA: FHA domain-containing protein [Anaeromyxobacteraceae bacterium]|nr:FHA domain-containing protein [Anaeromyxobacteraceae bacterium]